MMHRSPLLLLLTAALLLSFVSCTRTLTIATYNVGAFNKPGHSTVALAAEAMKAYFPDIIALQEVDSCTRRGYGVDQLRDFTHEMGFGGCHYTPVFPFNGGAYGIALSWSKRRTARDCKSVLLPRLDGSEVRALSVAAFKDAVICSTHLDHISGQARLAQADSITRYLLRLYAEEDIPVILCGDFNDTPDSPVIQQLRKDWNILTPPSPSYSADTPKACIDYIMLLKNKAEQRVNVEQVIPFAYPHPEEISDHLPFILKLKVKR